MNDGFLQSIDPFVLEFDDSIAIHANQMVVMRMIYEIGIVEFVLLAEIHFLEEPAFYQQRQCPVYCSSRHGFFDLACHGEKVFRGVMLGGAESGFDDRVTLCGMPKPFGGDEFIKPFTNSGVHRR